MQVIKNLKEIGYCLDKYHEEFLLEKGIYTPGKNFLCINPDHEDHNASMGFVPGSVGLVQCFGCGARLSILDSYAILQDTPRPGEANWIEKTLIPLADKYNVKVEYKDLSVEDKEILLTQRLNKDIEAYITSSKLSDEVKKEISRRKWDIKKCRQDGIGSIPSVKEFKEYLRSLGWQDNQIKDCALFSPTNLTFSIHDLYGNVIGFSSKNLAYDDKLGSYRYLHSANSLVFKKRETLHGVDLVRGLIKKGITKLYLVEGAADWQSLRQAGLFNVVALNGGSLTEEQCDLIRQMGFTELVICFDGDQAGYEHTEKAILELSGALSGVQILVKTLPKDLDPDEVIRKHGLDYFNSLEEKDSFTWRICNYAEGTDPYKIASEMIEIIAYGNNSPLIIDKYIRILHEYTGIDKAPLERQVQDIINSISAQQSEKASQEVKAAVSKIQKHPEKARELAERLIERLDDISSISTDNRYGHEEFLDAIKHQKEQEESADGAFQGFTLPSKPVLQGYLYGNWRQSKTVFIGGDPNAGKTNFIVDLTLDILAGNDGIKSDPYGKTTRKAIVFYHSTDDPREGIINRMVTNVASRYCDKVTMNMIANPKHYNHVEKLLEARDKAYAQIFQWIQEGRLLVKDVVQSKRLDFADVQLKKLRQLYNSDEYDIVYVMDNLSKVERDANREDHAAMAAVSEYAKEIAVRNKACVLSTIEYRKKNFDSEQPDERLKGTNQFFYDADITMHIQNESAYNPVSTKVWGANDSFKEVGSGETARNLWPVISLFLSKNKTSEHRQKEVFYKALPPQARYKEMRVD